MSRWRLGLLRLAAPVGPVELDAELGAASPASRWVFHCNFKQWEPGGATAPTARSRARTSTTSIIIALVSGVILTHARDTLSSSTTERLQHSTQEKRTLVRSHNRCGAVELFRGTFWRSPAAGR